MSYLVMQDIPFDARVGEFKKLARKKLAHLPLATVALVPTPIYDTIRDYVDECNYNLGIRKEGPHDIYFRQHLVKPFHSTKHLLDTIEYHLQENTPVLYMRPAGWNGNYS